MDNSVILLTSVLWRCWLGGKKGIWPVKKPRRGCGGGGAVGPVGVAPTRTVGASASIMLLPCSIKIQRSCFFWYRPTRVVPDQRPLNGTTLLTYYSLHYSVIDTLLTALLCPWLKPEEHKLKSATRSSLGVQVKLVLSPNYWVLIQTV